MITRRDALKSMLVVALTPGATFMKGTPGKLEYTAFVLTKCGKKLATDLMWIDGELVANVDAMFSFTIDSLTLFRPDKCRWESGPLPRRYLCAGDRLNVKIALDNHD